MPVCSGWMPIGGRKGSLQMERQKQSVTNRPVRDEKGGSLTASWRGRAHAMGHEAAQNAASTTQPRDAGRYLCACEGGATRFDIPRELQLFAAGRQSRNLLWSGTSNEGASPGSRGLSPDLAERPPPGSG